EGDDGGNAVKLTNPANLHTFWDDVMGVEETPSTALTAIMGLPTPAPAKVSDLNVDHWITESFNAARMTGYMSPPIGAGAGPFTVTPAYNTAVHTLAAQRIALAGARLAKMLNEELK